MYTFIMPFWLNLRKKLKRGYNKNNNPSLNDKATEPLSQKSQVKPKISEMEIINQRHVSKDLKNKDIDISNIPEGTVAFNAPKEQLGFLPWEFVNFSLPLRSRNTSWVRKNGNYKLRITPGKVELLSGNTEELVPSGKYARLINIFLCTSVKRTGSRDVYLGDSFYKFLHNTGIKKGGQTYKQVFRQLQALATATVSVTAIVENENILGIGDLGYRIGAKSEFWWDKKDNELLPSKIVISQEYFESIQNSANPIDFEKYMYLTATAGALASDVYMWLVTKIYKLKTPVRISFSQLHKQFGSEYNRERNFKPKFIEVIDKIKKIYPDLNIGFVGVGKNQGIILFPSKKKIESKSKNLTFTKNIGNL